MAKHKDLPKQVLDLIIIENHCKYHKWYIEPVSVHKTSFVIWAYTTPPPLISQACDQNRRILPYLTLAIIRKGKWNVRGFCLAVLHRES